MDIPFTTDEFLGVFEAYNLVIQPAQIVAYILGISAVVFGIKRSRYSSTIIFAILAVFWGWVGVVYHIYYFSDINQAAYVFGTFYIVQAILLLYAASTRIDLDFRFEYGVMSIVGAVFIMYAMVIYPILNYLFGHAYPGMPVFGITPCPLTVFTFGILLLAKAKVPLYLIAIPFLWSLIGISAAINLEIVEDYGLVVAGVIGTILIVLRKYEFIQAS